MKNGDVRDKKIKPGQRRGAPHRARPPCPQLPAPHSPVTYQPEGSDLGGQSGGGADLPAGAAQVHCGHSNASSDRDAPPPAPPLPTRRPPARHVPTFTSVGSNLGGMAAGRGWLRMEPVPHGAVAAKRDRAAWRRWIYPPGSRERPRPLATWRRGRCHGGEGAVMAGGAGRGMAEGSGERGRARGCGVGRGGDGGPPAEGASGGSRRVLEGLLLLLSAAWGRR